MSSSPLHRLFHELKRRKVFRVAGVYAVAAWGAVEVTETVAPLLHLPVWVPTLVLFLALLGFPIAILMAWALEVTPGGVQREKRAEQPKSEVAPDFANAPSRTAPTQEIPIGWRFAVVGAVIVLALAGGAFLLLDEGESSAFVADRIVVLPLENQTGDPSLDAVGRLAADWITQGITRSGIGEPVPLRDLLQTLPPEADPAALSAMEAASAMGAGLIVTGRYYKVGGDLELQADVFDARHDELIDAVAPITTSADDPRSGIQQLRQRVVGVVATVLDPREVLGGGSTGLAGNPPTLEAYQLFADGMDRFLRRDYADAIPLLLQATRLDTTFQQPKLMAAVAYMNLSQWEAVDSITAAVAARREQLAPADRIWVEALRAGVENDRTLDMERVSRLAELFPNSATVYQAGYQGVVFNRPYRTLRYLGSMDPSRGPMTKWSSYWRIYTSAHHLLGNYEEELETARRGQRVFSNPEAIRYLEIAPLAALGRFEELNSSLAPATASEWINRGDALRLAAAELRAHGHPARADRYLEEALDWYAGLTPEEQRQLRSDIAFTLYRAGYYDRARPLYESILEELPDPTATPARTSRIAVRGRLGAIAAHEGNIEEARRVEERLQAIEWPYMFGQPTLWQARIAAALGEHDRAARLLRKALYTDGVGFGTWVHVDPDFLPMGDHAAFQDVLRPRGGKGEGDG